LGEQIRVQLNAGRKQRMQDIDVNNYVLRREVGQNFKTLRREGAGKQKLL
jgi:hypothetical protein